MGCADWGVWGPQAPQHFRICQKFGQKAALLQESWHQYFL